MTHPSSRAAPGHPGLEPRHALRVVRLLPLRLARGLLRRPLLPARQRARGAAREPGHLRRGLRRAAARRARVRPHRRPRRPQVHVPRHDGHDGPRDRAHRLPAHLRDRRACSRRCSSSLLRLVQGLALGGEYGGAATYVAEHVPDERRGYYTSFIQTTATLGFFLSLGVIGACRAWLRARGVPGLRLARAVPGVVRAARGLALHPPEDARVAALREAQGRGPRLEEPAEGELREPEEPALRAARALRRDRGPGRRLVHGPVLRADLPAEAAQPRLAARLPARRRRARARARRSSSSSAASPTASAASASCSRAACSRRSPTCRSTWR